jgi:hypothetical protein
LSSEFEFSLLECPTRNRIFFKGFDKLAIGADKAIIETIALLPAAILIGRFIIRQRLQKLSG